MCTVELSLERVPQRDYDDEDVADRRERLCQDAEVGERGSLFEEDALEKQILPDDELTLQTSTKSCRKCLCLNANLC